jgi:hypothetical protein
MSNREALRKLSRKFPAPPEIAQTLEALSHEPDRSAAIVGAGLLETALERLIIKSLKHSTPRLIGELFENRGPLSDFRSKIIAACAFGVISPNQAQEFHSIRFIRNAFAHSRMNVSFATKEIAKEMDSSIMIDAMDRAGPIGSTNPDRAKTISIPRFKEMPAKQRFLLVVRIMFIMLDHDQRKLGGAPLEDEKGQKTPQPEA